MTASQLMHQIMSHNSVSPVAVYPREDMSSLGPSNVICKPSLRGRVVSVPLHSLKRGRSAGLTIFDRAQFAKV